MRPILMIHDLLGLFWWHNPAATALYLTFRTTDRDHSEAAKAILHSIGQALEAAGYEVDFEAGREDPDWLFAVRRDGQRFAVCLGVMDFAPCRWSISLEDRKFGLLKSNEIREAVNPILFNAVSSLPGVSNMKWHRTCKTLSRS